MKGEAEAYAVQVKAKADAEQMKRKAIAWQSYEDAAKTDMILEALPKVSVNKHILPFSKQDTEQNKIQFLMWESFRLLILISHIFFLLDVFFITSKIFHSNEENFNFKKPIWFSFYIFITLI